RHRSDPLRADHDAEPDDRPAASAARDGALCAGTHLAAVGRAHDDGHPALAGAAAARARRHHLHPAGHDVAAADHGAAEVSAPRITAVDLYQVDLPPPVPRSDAIQSFVTQETPLVRVRCSDGSEGVGYSYTIGTGGSSVMALLRDHLAPRLIGRDPSQVEAIWRDLLFATHATSVGAITSLALAAIDTALWDWRCRRDDQPLWRAAGGAQERVPLYTTEGGWLHLSPE